MEVIVLIILCSATSLEVSKRLYLGADEMPASQGFFSLFRDVVNLILLLHRLRPITLAFLTSLTERQRHGRVVRAQELKSGGRGFKYRSDH